MDSISHYDSPLGPITLASDGVSLCGLWFDGQKHEAATLSDRWEEKELPVFEQTAAWLDDYFSGKDPDFSPPLQLRGSPFQLAVWELLRGIPYGSTVSYGQIAQELAGRTGRSHMSPRAVGAAVGRNPISLIVPCHRVIGAQGDLTGYAGGIERKRWLLAMEKGKAPGDGAEPQELAFRCRSRTDVVDSMPSGPKARNE